jgi:His-Xaa-Ser system radical SAM maturase HxsC
MKLRTKGKAHNLDHHLVLKVTRFLNKAQVDSNYALLVEGIVKDSIEDGITILTQDVHELNSSFRGVYGIKELSHLAEDDIVYIGIDGNIRTLYRVNSNHNSILVTERCNSNCLMCSQPPIDRDDIDHHHSIHKLLIPLIPKNCGELGITGGEPTILGDRLFELLKLIKQELPSTEVHILTNGRAFAINALAKKLSDLNNPRIMLGIPLYSDFYQIHDYVVQTEDAYYQTLMGIYNLKRYDIRVEIRVVLHKATIPRLENLSRFIYKNLPFINQIALMGLEVTGYTKANMENLWIDQHHYQSELRKSVLFLANKGMNVKIYNITLCNLPLDIWDYAVRSISDWKNHYSVECSKCAVKDECGGLFTTSGDKQSEYIKAYEVDPRIKALQNV